MSETPTVAANSPGTAAKTDGIDPEEEPRTQRRRLAAVWVAAGSAVAATVAVGWYEVVRLGGLAPGGDMIGHAAAAEWLRTLPWWDWRGWSDWFYGGQAMGVNYPPLGHAWMRFTHPVHGQMAAVAVGLLVLLPWGALRLARAVGFSPHAQRFAVGSVLVLAAISGEMHWVLSGFHFHRTFFGSWPAMLALVLGLFCAAWAARCRRPVSCGVVAGVAILFNATVMPGVAVVCTALLVTSGASFRQAARWAATAGAAGLAVCAWWLVPFLAGWDRLVRWNVSLALAWDFGGVWQAVIVAAVGVAVVWSVRKGSDPARRLALAALAGLGASVLAELFGYLRPERWLEPAILLAAVAVAGLSRADNRRFPVRPAWALIGVAFLIVFVEITIRVEILPLAVWLLWWPRRTWAAAGALAWTGVLVWVPLWAVVHNAATPDPAHVTPLAAAAASGGPATEGLVALDRLYNTTSGDVRECSWGQPWLTTKDTGGSVRPLAGLYVETSPVAEFVDAERSLRVGAFSAPEERRPHWFDLWQALESPATDSPGAAEALGARWYAACDAEGNVSVIELTRITVGGAAVTPHPNDDDWHKAAVEWWLPIAAGTVPDQLGAGARPVPIRSTGESAAYPRDRVAEGVTLNAGRDSLTVHAEEEGWAWLRVPWDPDWRSVDGTPVRKGGPGHLVIWANQGVTELRWAVPREVDVASAVTTGVAALASVVLVAVNRRRGFEPDPGRHRPAAEALAVFGDTVDGWAHGAARRVRGLLARSSRQVNP